MDAEFISQTFDSQTVIIKVRGNCDRAAIEEFRAAMLGALEAGCRVLLLDVQDVTYLDSSGLGVMVGGLRRATEFGASFALVSPTPAVQRILELTRLDNILEVFPNAEQALAHYQKDHAEEP